MAYTEHGVDCRLSLRERNAAFAERKATVPSRQRIFCGHAVLAVAHAAMNLRIDPKIDQLHRAVAKGHRKAAGMGAAESPPGGIAAGVAKRRKKRPAGDVLVIADQRGGIVAGSVPE